jgi:hypothetical protein
MRRWITFSLVFCLALFLSVLLAPPSQGGNEEKMVSSQKPSTQEVSVIPEAASIVLNPIGIKSKGEITIKPDSHWVRCEVEITSTFDSAGGEAPVGTEPLFFPGVKHIYVGCVCFPAQRSGFNAGINTKSHETTEGSPMRIRLRGDGSALVTGGPVATSGTIIIAVANDAPVFDVDSDTSDPLNFMLTPKGYNYVSGKGSVKTPEGKLYTFSGKRSPETDDDSLTKPLLIIWDTLTECASLGNRSLSNRMKLKIGGTPNSQAGYVLLPLEEGGHIYIAPGRYSGIQTSPGLNYSVMTGYLIDGVPDAQFYGVMGVGSYLLLDPNNWITICGVTCKSGSIKILENGLEFQPGTIVKPHSHSTGGEKKEQLAPGESVKTQSADVQETKTQVSVSPKDVGILGKIEDKKLGLWVATSNRDLAAQYNVEFKKGVIVLDVKTDSPAEQAGLSQGDIIMQMNSKEIKNIEDFEEVSKSLKDTKKGILFSISRNGVLYFVALKR